MSRFDQEQAMREACAKDPYPTKAYVGATLNDTPNVGAGYDAQNCCSSRPNIFALLNDRINYHFTRAHRLTALLDALPRKMNLNAEEALADVLLESRPRY